MNHKDKRLLVLEPLPGKKPTDVRGLIDSRLFNGNNELYAIRDYQYNLWRLQYREGGLPEPLRQHFTSFNTLLHYTTTYFQKRNVRIKEIID
jgi:hypothetical protein